MTNLNHVAIYCMNNPKHQMFRAADGANCLNCGGPMNVKPVSEREFRMLPGYSELLRRRDPIDGDYKKTVKTNEIEIIMLDANQPPKIKLDGKEIKGIIELDYKYQTKEDTESSGCHNFTLKYMDNETNTIRTVSVKRSTDGTKSIKTIIDDRLIFNKQKFGIKNTEIKLYANDNIWQCEYCGHVKYVVHHTALNGDLLCKCARCNEKCVIKVDDELPTTLKDSEQHA